jgi:hypothetical protein
MNDTALYGDPKNASYIESRIEYSTSMEIPNGDGGFNAFISAYIMMDDT